MARLVPAARRRSGLRIEGGRKIRRAVNGLVVELSADGVRVRGERRRGWVQVTWAQLAKQGLLNSGLALTADEWGAPLRSVRRLSKIKQAGG